MAYKFPPPSGGAANLITTYLTNDTWTKDAATTYVEVFCWSGGGGGGSGRKGLTTAAGGGGGGSGGSFFYIHGPASVFGNTEPVVVGVGGPGGAAQAADGNNGNAGTAGGLSSFGNYVATGGAAGAGGTTTTAAGGSGNYQLYMIDGDNTGLGAGNGRNTTGLAASSPIANATVQSMCTPLSGGGGSGFDAVTVRVGGDGAGYVNMSSTIIRAGGAGGIETGTINGGVGLNQPTSGGLLHGGTGGGGGGGISVGGVAGTGGDGGFPGGGAGGGGGGASGVASSGAGGTGGDGYIIVVEWF